MSTLIPNIFYYQPHIFQQILKVYLYFKNVYVIYFR